MLNNVYRSGSLLNPCSYLKGKRTEQYTDALNNSYNPGSGQVLINLPVDTTLDLSSSYLDFDVNFINGTDEVPLILDLRVQGDPATNSPASGHFQIEYDGDISGQIQWDCTALQVQTVLRNMHPINGRFFQVDCTGGPLPGTPIQVTIGGFNNDNQKVDDISAFAVVGSNMTTNASTALGSPAFYTFNYIQNSVFSYPRLEKWNCVFQKMSIVVNNKNVYDVQDFDILYNIMQLGRHTYARWEDELVTASEDEGGAPLPGQETMRVQINLKGIDLFKQLFPLNVFKGIKIQLQASMQEATQCLIIGGATVDNNNPFNQSYQISNLRLHYYTVELHESDLKAINDVYQSEGVAIPFFNVASFTDSIDGGITQKNINFSPQASNVIGAYSVFLSNGYMGLSSNQRKRSTFLGNFLESYRMKLGSFYFPSDVSKCSNTYFYSTDIWNEYKNFTELILRQNNQGDYLGGETFRYDITDPTVRIYSTEQQRLLNINTVLTSMTCDNGYDSLKNERCPLSYFQGVDTSNSSSNYLQVIGMTVESPETVFIFVFTQDSLVFKPGQMIWNH